MSDVEETDLILHLGLPGSTAPARPTLPVLGYNFSPKPATLVTEHLNRLIHGRYNEIPEAARSSIVHLHGVADFFLLDHNQMEKGYYFCNETSPEQPQWRIVHGPSNLDGHIGQSISYNLVGTNVRVTKFTSFEEQQAPALAIYRITSTGPVNLRVSRPRR